MTRRNRLYREYMKERAKYPHAPAKHALQAVRATRKTRTLPFHYSDVTDRGTTFKVKGYDVTVRSQPDDDPDLSFYGKFTDTMPRSGEQYFKRGHWSEGFTDSRGHRFSGEWQFPHRELRYFVPGYNHLDDIDTYRRTYGRHEAYTMAMAYARRDWRRMEDYGSGWAMVGITVTVSRHGVELGNASLWGIESDSTEHVYDVVQDLLAEALTEARKNREALCR